MAQDIASSEEPPEGLPASDWSGIREAYQVGRHRMFKTAEGFQARNPGQQWLTKFDGTGFLAQPTSGGWSWGLELEAFGFAGAMQVVPDSARARSEGNRIVYEWNADLEEWYVNDRSGLEHGYTLHSRPAGARNEGKHLTFDLLVRGSLHAEVHGDGNGVAFLNAQGTRIVTYAGLHVYDADGVTQVAAFVAEDDRVRISIAEHGAKYPLTIDPIAQQAYLKASDTDDEDFFGYSVAISGELAVVGALFEASNATGVNGDHSDNSAQFAGAVYVFERSGGVWSQQAYLKASNTGAGDWFGYSVAFSGDLLVVGAPHESSNATGVDGDQSNNSYPVAGAVYIFERSGGVWSQQAYLKASNTRWEDSFGDSVAISGDLVVVGASREDSNATGVNGDQSDRSASEAGAAYVFERSSGIWSQQAYLKASNTQWNDHFGNSVGVSGSLVVVGALSEGSEATGVDGDQLNNFAANSGAAYVFERSGGIWSQQAYLKAATPDVDAWFGISVAISGDSLVVGASKEDSSATGVDGDPSNNATPDSGAAFVFERSGGIWSQQAYLKASNTGPFDWFGSSVAISGGLIVVGAHNEDSNTTGVDGNPSDNSTAQAGAAYVFERSGGTWSSKAYLKASNTDAEDWFGLSVAVSEDLVIVGAPFEDSYATGVNGDQSDNSGNRPGAAYLFNLAAPTATYCSPGAVNSAGLTGSIDFSGSVAVASNSLTLEVTQLPPNVLGYFLSSQGRDRVLHPGGAQGTLCLGGGASIGRHHSSTSNSGGTGTISHTLDLTSIPTPTIPTAILVGETWNFQCWYRDFNPGATSNFTAGLSVLFE